MGWTCWHTGIPNLGVAATLSSDWLWATSQKISTQCLARSRLHQRSVETRYLFEVEGSNILFVALRAASRKPHPFSGQLPLCCQSSWRVAAKQRDRLSSSETMDRNADPLVAPMPGEGGGEGGACQPAVLARAEEALRLESKRQMDSSRKADIGSGNVSNPHAFARSGYNSFHSDPSVCKDSETEQGQACRPRVVVIGAGVSGLTAAVQLAESKAFDVIVLEGSSRIGGRIFTSGIGGEKVELGATYIHGIEGSPIYKIAEEADLLNTEGNWETGESSPSAVRRLGGAVVDRQIVKEMRKVYSQALAHSHICHSEEESLGDFLDMQLEQHLDRLGGVGTTGSCCTSTPPSLKRPGPSEMASGTDNSGMLSGSAMVSERALQSVHTSNSQSSAEGSGGSRAPSHAGHTQAAEEVCAATEQSIPLTERAPKLQTERCRDESNVKLAGLRKAVFNMMKNREKTICGCDDVGLVNFRSFREYRDFPGQHAVIPKGYQGVVESLARRLPAGVVQFNKRVVRIEWARTAQHCHNNNEISSDCVVVCEGGEKFVADHVVLTVSLGVLKAAICQSRLARTVKFESLEDGDSQSGQGGGGKGKENTEKGVIEGFVACGDVVGWYNLPDDSAKSLANDVIVFDPPLPDWKIHAIERLGFGVVDKVFLEVSEGDEEDLEPIPTWMVFDEEASRKLKRVDDCREGTQADMPRWMERTYGIHRTSNDSHVLLTWVVGKDAVEMEMATDDEVGLGMLRTMKAFGAIPRKGGHRGDVNKEEEDSREEKVQKARGGSERADNEDEESVGGKLDDLAKIVKTVLRSKWWRNPLFRGSYSYVPVGSSGEDIDALAEPLPGPSEEGKAAYDKEWVSNGDLVGGEEIEGKTQPSEDNRNQLLFAGEATDRHHYSTTHGAYLSGLREADRLISHYMLRQLT